MTVGPLLALGLRLAAPLLLLLLVSRLPRVRRSALLQQCWSAVVLVLLLSPVLAMVGVRLDLPVLPAPQPMPLASVAPEIGPGRPAPAVNGLPVTEAEPVGSSTVPRGMLEGYLCIVAVVLVRRWRAEWAVRRLIARAKPVDGMSEIRREVRSIAGELGVAAPEVRTSAEVAVPCVAGVWRPVLLLPTPIDGWSDAERRGVLRHELAHVVRGDLVRHATWDVAVAIWWWHPLVWLAAREVRRLSEFDCDAIAVEGAEDAEHYATALVAVARRVVAARPVVGAIALDGGTLLAARIQALLRGTTPMRLAPRGTALRTATVLLLLLVVALAVPVDRPMAQSAEGKSTRNISVGGRDISTNRAGLQARWIDQGRLQGLFVTGAGSRVAHTEGDRLPNGLVALRVRETSRGVTADELRPGAALEVGREVAAWIADLVEGLNEGDVDRGQPSPPRAPRAPSGGGGPRATQTGLPAVSDDPGARVIQAGWVQDGVRYAVMAKGTWRVLNGMPVAGDRQAWLVLHGVDLGTLATRLVILDQDRPRPETPQDAAWAASVLRVLEAVRRD